MTKRQALTILFKAAGRDAAGVGVGIRQIPSEEKRMEIARAIKRLWRDAYNFDPQASDFSNMGLPQP